MCDPPIAPMIPGIPERASKSRAHCSNHAIEAGNLINSGVSRLQYRLTTEAVNNRTHRRVLVSERPLRIMIDVVRYVAR
jgi:hypothetical protein